MHGSWFPFKRELVNNENFKQMSPAQRLCFLLLVSEFNLRGSFYKADQEIAVTIHASVDAVRRARKKLEQLGWIETRPGFRDSSGRGVATTYFNVKFARIIKGSKTGKFFTGTSNRMPSCNFYLHFVILTNFCLFENRFRQSDGMTVPPLLYFSIHIN